MTASPPAFDPAVERALIMAQALHEAGWLAKAEEVYRAVLRDRPGHAEALYRLGCLRSDAGDRAEAAALVGAAIAADAEPARYHITMARLLALGADMPAAADRFRRVLALEPGNTDALTRYASLRVWEKRHADAETLYRRALAIAPDDPAVLKEVGRFHLAKGEPQAAEAPLRAALGGDAPPDVAAPAAALLGDALAAQDRHAEAAEAYGYALSLQPGVLDAHLGLAAALEGQGRRDEAAQALLAAAEALGHDADALLRIGERLFDRGHEAEAAAVYTRFAALTPERERFPGNPPRSVAVRTAAEVCRARGWPYHSVAPAERIRPLGVDGTPYPYELPDVFLAFAEDAVIVPRVHAPVVGGDGILLDGFNTNSRGSLLLVPHMVWRSRDERMLLDLPEPARVIEEEAILLGGGPNWSHGVLDWSSKLAVLERFPELAHLPVLVSGDVLPSILDLFGMLGLERGRIRTLAPGEVVRARRLWLPSLTHRYQYMAPMQLEFLRRRLAGPMAEGMARPRRRIYLSRRQAGYRALLNEAELLTALAPFGVEAVVPEDLSMAEQIKLFASAELVVGPIGGATAAIAFTPPDCAYVELVHGAIALVQYKIITALLGQRYRQVVGEARASRSRFVFDNDFTVPVGEVAAAVREFLDGR